MLRVRRRHHRRDVTRVRGRPLGLATSPRAGRMAAFIMKKPAITALAVAVCGGVSGQEPVKQLDSAQFAKDLSVRADVGWQAKNVFRGKERSDEDGLFQTKVGVEYFVPGVSGLSAYASFFNADAIERSYAYGLRKTVGDAVVDAGYLRMTSPSAKFFSNAAQGFTQLRAEDEAYLGVILPKSFLQPALYVNYGFNLDQVVVEGSLYHDFKEVGPFKLDVTLRGFAGNLFANDALDDGSGAQNAYAYAGAGLDLSKSVGQGSVIGVGVNYAVNNDNLAATRNSQVWTGVFAKFRF